MRQIGESTAYTGMTYLELMDSTLGTRSIR